MYVLACVGALGTFSLTLYELQHHHASTGKVANIAIAALAGLLTATPLLALTAILYLMRESASALARLVEGIEPTEQKPGEAPAPDPPE